ncbi:uncharacterized protein LOC129580781 isoform X2 [Paramacrobiotus metropolitanus]|uniref:uncharacterized protein LOC129580781 isoform X2 n=1 Tax=Paramacrobiotus metropolitanus TaxID=2943436 RepID=UPI002445793F|nr:uncharacterized protein LOC129580781 isoform X2 [Paramacrobiotus metropolitanus]
MEDLITEMNRSGQYRLCQLLHLRICTDQYGDYSYYDHAHEKANHRDDRYITVSVSDNPPWNFESPPNSGCFCGVSISILSIISKELNYRFQLIFAKSPLNKFRTSDNVSYDGSPADVLLGNVMMSACPLAANPARVRDFELIAGYITRDYYISVHNRSFLDATMTSQPILTTLVWNSLQELWPGMLVAAFGLGCVTLVTNHITKRLINRRYHKPVSGGTVISVQGDSALNSESMWDRFVFMGQDALQVGFKIAASIFKQCERYRPGRFHGTNLAGLILLMYSLVTSSIMDARLSSSLTASPFVPPFQSVSEFVTSNFVPLLQAGTIQLALMNSSGLREVLPKVMIYDSGSSVDKFVDYATTLSQTSNIALIATEETAVFLKGGFIPVTPTNLFGFIAIFQLPHQSPFARNITELYALPFACITIFVNMSDLLAKMHHALQFTVYLEWTV